MTALDTTVVEQNLKLPSRKSVFRLFLCGSVAALVILMAEVVWSGATEGYCWLWPGIGTHFAPDFSHRGFVQIEPGMTPSDVETLIGIPLGKGGKGSPGGWAAYRPGDETWAYSQDSSRLGGDWAWLSREVVFRDGRVVQTVRWVFHD